MQYNNPAARMAGTPQQAPQRMSGYPQQPQPQQQQPQPAADGSVGQMIPAGDGNQDYRAAKRLKPTTRSLPRFNFDVTSSTSDRLKHAVEALDQLSQSYDKLQQLERKVDWNISKSQVEAAERLPPPGVKRKMRFHIVTRAKDQSWQTEGEPEPDFEKGVHVPKVELVMTAELLPRTAGGTLTDEEKQLRFSDLVKQVTIESDRVPESGENVGPFEWRSGSGNHAGGLTVSLPSTGTVTFRLAVHPNHEPDLFCVSNEFANLIQLSTGERAELLRALWTYARKNNLIEQGGIRTTDAMRRIFHNQNVVQYHHVPEYLNRYLAPPAPMLIEVKADSKVAESHFAWDMLINTRDRARASSVPAARPATELDEIRALDEEISAACTKAQPLPGSIKSLNAFTVNPVEYLEQYVASQSADLGKALGDHELGHKEGWKPKSEREWQEIVRQARV